MRTTARRIALHQISGSTYANDALTGIYRYARTTNVWNVVDFASCPVADTIESIARWRADAVITCLEGELAGQIEELGKLSLPITNLTSHIAAKDAAGVYTCPDSIAELAHEHFSSLAVKHFGYFCIRNFFNLTSEQQALRARLTNNGQTLHSFQADLPFLAIIDDQPDVPESLVTWLQSLPKPIGILCDSDRAGTYLIRACQRLGLAVPYDVGILGITNDQSGRLVNPPLSSIVCPSERIGYEAARLIDQLLEEKPGVETNLPIRATGVITRASTRPEMMDPNISAAMEYIQENAPHGISVSDVMTTQTVSRVTFERRFKLVTGRSPGAEIRRLRLERIKELLLCSQLKASEIATECGFESATNLSLFFKKATGTSPIAFRNEHAS